MKPNFKDGYPFPNELFAVEMRKTEIKTTNKPVYLGTNSIGPKQDANDEFHYDYIQPKYGRKAKLCYMNSFVYEIEAEDFHKDIANDIVTKFDTSGYPKDDNRPQPIGKNKKVVGMIKNKLGVKIMTEFVALKGKMYA